VLPLLVRIELKPQGRDSWPRLDVPLRANPVQSTGLLRMRLPGQVQQ
jgi:general secretion pathway protein J